MSTETLEELRMLSNINSDKHQLLQLVLVGQPELRRKLRRPELRQFAQRVSVAYYLELLTAEETADYVRHRLARAGGDPELFEADALRALHHHAGGVPRVINSLADMALVYGFAEDRAGIGIDIIEEVARDKVRTGLFEDPDEPSAGDTAGDAAPLHRVR
jgi:type II secretory pathway predicted ATPase ExeA